MGHKMNPARSTLDLRPARWLGLGIMIVGLLIAVYGTIAILEAISQPASPGVAAASLPIGPLVLGLVVFVVGLVTAVIAVRAKDVWPP